MAKTKTDYDPLSCIPSADVVRRRLHEERKIVKRLEVLLETAERIEAVTDVGRQTPHELTSEVASC